MNDKPRIDHLHGDPPQHEEGDPATLSEDPAQFEPTGGAGLINPANEAERDAGGLTTPPRRQPDAGTATPSGNA